MSDPATSTTDSTADTMRARSNENRYKLWFLLRVNRLVLTAILCSGVFVTFLVFGVTIDGAIESLQSGDTKGALFSTMLGAIITGTTLVVTISQLILSQETGPLGDQHERMSNTMDIRARIGDIAGQPVPADPAAFLQHLLVAIDEQAQALRTVSHDSTAPELQSSIETLTDSITQNATEVHDQLVGAQFGTFDVVFAALNFNYSWKLFRLDQLTDDYPAMATGEIGDHVDELRTLLTLFGPAREHIKTLYFQWALADLSRLILYTALPALVASGGMLAFVGSTPIAGTTIGIPNVLWVVSCAFAFSTLPFLLLAAYIVRIVTVAKRTLAIGPIVLRESD